MSRAFISEKDGWSFCIKYSIECISAGINGECLRKKCNNPNIGSILNKEKKEKDKHATEKDK